MSVLTIEQIVECCGERNLEKVEDLEILFSNFEEFGTMEGFCNLRRLSCIDNGLLRINNLHPLGPTLTSLTLCDQSLTSIGVLPLPHLKELFLHRNALTSIGDLAGCPRLQKLWLFQNQISTISGLHALPQLEELWLQANNISRLTGLESTKSLSWLALAGNPISDFRELKRLGGNSALAALTLSDIHFGRCPLADEEGYREFVVLQLPQVTSLDGISVTQGTQQAAQASLLSQAQAFNSSLQEVEDGYQRALRGIDSQYQSRESHSHVLEKEMSAALKELQGLVSEGRGAITQQVSHNRRLITSAGAALQSSLEHLENQAKQALRESLQYVHTEFDEAAGLLALAEQVAWADAELLGALAEAARMGAGGMGGGGVGGADSKSPARAGRDAKGRGENGGHGNGNGNGAEIWGGYGSGHVGGDAGNSSGTSRDSSGNGSGNGRGGGVVFQAVSSNSADFQMVSALVSPRRRAAVAGAGAGAGGGVGGGVGPGRGRGKGAVTSTGAVGAGAGTEEGLELARLYRVACPNFGDIGAGAGTEVGGAGAGGGGFERVFTVLAPDALKSVLLGGWGALSFSPVFSPDADVAALLHQCVGLTLSQPLPAEYQAVLKADCVPDSALLGAAPDLGVGGLGQGVGVGQEVGRGSSNADKLPRLAGAQSTKLHLLVCCKLNPHLAGLSPSPPSASPTPSLLSLPSSPDLRAQLVLELMKSKRPQRVMLSYSNSSSNSGGSSGNSNSGNGSSGGVDTHLIYLLPPQHASAAVVDFAALCLSPPLQGGLRGIEGRLEPLLLPSHGCDRTAHLLGVYEMRAAEQVKGYLDRVLEEVDDKSAQRLREAEAEVQHREGSLRSMREEVERERRQQELLLRDAKNMGMGQGNGGEGQSSPGERGGGGMQYSTSNSNMTGQAQRQARSSKR